MRTTNIGTAVARSMGVLGAAGVALLMAQAPARAATDISNFNVRNCASQRIFVCSFDKTDGRMDIPYKAAGIQPGKRKEFGCASIGRCKVIIGVSKRKAKNTLSSGMKAAIAAGGVATGAASGAGAVVGLYVGLTIISPATAAAAGGVSAMSLAIATGSGAVVAGIAAGGAIGGLEIADGLSDGDICNQVRRAAKKAGLEPKDFMQNGKKYMVVPQYATDSNGNPYLNPDGTAVLAYVAKKGNSCPAALQTKLVK